MLQVKGLRAFYGLRPVLFGLDFEVQPGQAVALLGRNGMGKTATLKSLMGLIRFRADALRWGNVDLSARPAQARAALGWAYAPQEGRVFPGLSVAENVRLGGGRHPQRLEALLRAFPALRARWRQSAGTLSGGEQQMLGLVRALAAGPRLLLLDEPSEGLMPALVERLQDLLGRFVAEGGGLLVAEQRVDWVRAWCDWVLILERGRLTFTGSPTELTAPRLRSHLGLGLPPGAGKGGTGAL